MKILQFKGHKAESKTKEMNDGARKLGAVIKL